MTSLDSKVKITNKANALKDFGVSESYAGIDNPTFLKTQSIAYNTFEGSESTIEDKVLNAEDEMVWCLGDKEMIKWLKIIEGVTGN